MSGKFYKPTQTNYKKIGDMTTAEEKAMYSGIRWGLIALIGAIAITGLVLGAVCMSYFKSGGWSTPSATISQLTVGGPIQGNAKRNAKDKRDTAGDPIMLSVEGSTLISGDLFVTGAVARAPSDCAGTTLTAAKTGTPTYTQYNSYSWSVTKSLTSSNNITIRPGECSVSQYDVHAIRTLSSMTFRHTISGSVTVTNGGAVSTANLAINDVVQVMSGCTSGPFVDTGHVFSLDVSAQPILAPGQTYIYSYEIDMSLIPSFNPACNYKNTARVVIENHSGCLPGCPQCPGTTPCQCGPAQNGGGVKTDAFTFPTTPSVVIEYNETAKITDQANVPAGLTCNNMPGGAIAIPTEGICEFDGSMAHCTISTECCNTALVCDTWVQHTDRVQLMTVDEATPLIVYSPGMVTVNVYSGECPTGTGCTLTIGYWKTHAGFTGNNADRVTQYLPVLLGCPPPQYSKGANVTSAAQSTSILTFNALAGGASNGLNKVAAQLLAAKLNIANGASHPAGVDATIATAMGYLCSYGFNAGTWSSRTSAQKSAINSAASTLDAYNNGLAVGGPAHC